MPAPNNRVPVVVARGNKATLDASISAIKEGEIVLATDEDILYANIGGTLTAVGQAGGGGAAALNELTDVDTTGQNETSANFLRLSGGVYKPSAANIKQDTIAEIEKLSGAAAGAEMTTIWDVGDFLYADQAAWETGGWTYIAGSGSVASQINLTDTDFPFDPSTVSTTWATGTYLGVAVSPSALWTVSSAGSLCIANDGVSRVQDYNRQFNSSIYNTIDIAIQAVYEPSFAGAGFMEVVADQQWVVRLQVCNNNQYNQTYGYIVEYIFNADGTIRCNAGPTNDALVTVPFWDSDNRSGVSLSGDEILGLNGFNWGTTNVEAHSTLVGGIAEPFSLVDFNGIDVTDVKAGDLAQFDADGNITPGHDALKEMTDISANVPMPLTNVEKSTGGFFDVPGAFRFFYGGNFTDPFSGEFTVSGTSVYFDDRGSALDGSGTYLLGPWFRTYVTGSSIDFWYSTSATGPWTKHTATGGLIEQTVDDTYRLDGVSTSGSLSSSGYFAFSDPAATGYNDGDVLAWDTTEGAWITRGKIDTDDFKALVAASTDFADFQTRVAAIPSFRS